MSSIGGLGHQFKSLFTKKESPPAAKTPAPQPETKSGELTFHQNPIASDRALRVSVMRSSVTTMPTRLDAAPTSQSTATHLSGIADAGAGIVGGASASAAAPMTATEFPPAVGSPSSESPTTSVASTKSPRYKKADISGLSPDQIASVSVRAVGRAAHTFQTAAELILQNTFKDSSLGTKKAIASDFQEARSIVFPWRSNGGQTPNPDALHPLLNPTGKKGVDYQPKLLKDYENKIVEIIMKHTGKSEKSARKLLTEKRTEVLSTRTTYGFQRIDKTLSSGGTSTMTPASSMLPETYGERRGVPSTATTEPIHAVNLWKTELSSGPTIGTGAGAGTGAGVGVSAGGDEAPTFVGFRHGIHSAYGIKDGMTRSIANQNRVQEMIASMVSPDDIAKYQADVSAYREAPEGKTAPTLRISISSVSMVTPSTFSPKEGVMLKDQQAAYDALNGSTLYIDGPDRSPDGSPIKIPVSVEISSCNFATNAGMAKSFNTDVQATNARYMDTLSTRLDSWLEKPGNEGPSSKKELVTQLKAQIDSMWSSESYKEGSGDPYKMASRLILLNSLIDVKSAFNCKSGKDRTGMADIEAKFLLTCFNTPGVGLPEPNAPLTPAQHEIYNSVLLESGNLEITEANTGGLGLKIGNVGEQAHTAGKFFMDTGLMSGRTQGLTPVAIGLSSNFGS